MKSRFKEMLRCFSEEFDLVVVDTPPLLMVTDAEIIAGQAGATILVLRSGMQSESEIVDTLKKLERFEARVVGAIFNAIPVRRNNRHYGYAARSYSNNQLDITA
jgi:tyrosine-protein kinase Etk/Wzc